jgi:hypothetical protein
MVIIFGPGENHHSPLEADRAMLGLCEVQLSRIAVDVLTENVSATVDDSSMMAVVNDGGDPIHQGRIRDDFLIDWKAPWIAGLYALWLFRHD